MLVMTRMRPGTRRCKQWKGFVSRGSQKNTERGNSLLSSMFCKVARVVLVLLVLICGCRGGPHIAAATWLAPGCRRGSVALPLQGLLELLKLPVQHQLAGRVNVLHALGKVRQE